MGVALTVLFVCSGLLAEGAQAATPKLQQTPNPTCGSSNGLMVCIQPYSTGQTSTTGLLYSYTGAGDGNQFANWTNDQSFVSGHLETNCVGPNFSIFQPLAVGEYNGTATMITGAPGQIPTVSYDLAVGGSTPPPSPSCVTPVTPPHPVGTVHEPVVGMASTSDGQGYWLVGSDGSVQAHGDALWAGDLPTMGVSPNKPIVGIAPTGDGQGYWLDATDGGIFAFGDAQFYGSMGGQPLNKPMVSMAATKDGRGYWTVASDGGIFSFGDAQFYGSMGSVPLNQPVDGMAVDVTTGGYWMVAADGGIFSFNAPFYGSTGSIHLNKPIIEMEAAPDGSGYRFAASDGGVFCFNLSFQGSLPGLGISVGDVSGMAASGPNGYWIVERDTNVYPFGDAPAI
jgi:hypothetical protein